MVRVRFAPSPAGSLHVGNALSAVAKRRLGDWLPVPVDDLRKLSKRAEVATVASLRDSGIPAEAVRAYLEELGVPKHDVRLDLPRLRRLSIEKLGELPDSELAARVGVPVSVAPVLRGARDLVEAREYATLVLEPPAADVD